jgi:hypothetical protein
MLPPVNSLNPNLFTGDPEVERVRKTRQNRSSGFVVGALKGQWVRPDARHKRIDCNTGLPPEPLASSFVPLAHLKHFGFGLRPENNMPRHAQLSSLRRTSAHGTAELGF